jgi:hypothetical protein
MFSEHRNEIVELIQ